VSDTVAVHVVPVPIGTEAGAHDTVVDVERIVTVTSNVLLPPL
jgi:hypothetical protein